MRRADAGLTLIEVLVVLSIVAVMAGATVMLVPRSGERPALARAASTLEADLAQAARQTAALARAVSLEWTERGYRLTTGGKTIERDLPRGVRMRADQAGPYHVSPLGVPSALSPLELVLSDRDQRRSLHFDGLNVTEKEAPDARG